MSVTLADLSLRTLTLHDLPRLKRLREQNLAARAEVCIERARWVTRSLQGSGPDTPMPLRYASAVNQFLSHKEPIFFADDDNLLAGTTTSKRFGAPVYPELTGLTIWPELDTMSTRKKNPQKLAAADAAELNFDIFPYWLDRSILEVTRAREGNPPEMRLFEKIVFFLAGKAGAISHTVPCYQLVLEKGLQWLIAEAKRLKEEASGAGTEIAEQQEFYDSMATALEGILAYAANLSRKAAELAANEKPGGRKENLLAMAEVCANVPARPPRNFREAVNALWLLQVGVHAENINMAISPGRLDQVLYPWYRHDIDTGILTIPQAVELVGCLWIKLNDNTNLVPETAEELFGGAGTVPAVTLGGVDAQGEDAVNDLTYVMLKATELLRTRDPSVNARFHPGKNSLPYLCRVAEVIATTRSVPALYNDIPAIETLTNQGVAPEHARDYAIIGCVELAAAGRSYDASSSIMLNLVAALELALYNGKRPITGETQIGPVTGDPASFTSYADFEAAFKTQLSWLIGEAVKVNEALGRSHQERLPTPLLSALFQGPMQKGRDLIRGGALYNASGATHIGFADTVDSLNAIEQTVFVEKRFTLPQILEAIRGNFAGADTATGAWLATRAPKYGTSHPVAQKNSAALLEFLYHTYQGHVNYRGGRYRPAFWTMTNHAGQGKLAGALPNGRRANTVFASGITPVSQAAASLPECLAAVGGIDARYIPGGEAFNMKMVPVQSPADLQLFTAYLAAYFASGGLHIQFNLMSYLDLMEAKAHPERYPDLLVRVSGYSAYFRDLNDAMKDEIITRTAYDTSTGRAIALPVQGLRSQI
jgi:pyruvate formate-lyase/glycerol dehydratase family glycyl radical enzyme